MRIRLAVPGGLNSDEKEAVMNAALEAVTRASEPLIERGAIPTFSRALQAGRVKWKPEPPGDEHFDVPQTILKRGWGDCDDLAPWHAASLRASGQDPEAQAFVYPSGPGRYHAVVQRSNGRVVDPSKAAGMGSVGSDGQAGPFWPVMFGDRMSLATSPLYPTGWGSRVDLPDESLPFAMSALARASQPHNAIIRAIEGALACGHDISAADEYRLAGLHDLLCGEDPFAVQEALDHMGAVGFLPALLPAAASLAAPLASKALGMFGGMFGGGAPGAPAAPAAAAPGGGGGYGGAQTPGSTLAIPGGPIIVRF